ncbi:MAG: hypothetical protein M1834_003813 [Cirrosporium novae-zelandiae]|nr:MAG: hypothetical protein M1834_003813 [Cirrosporium novae-zelandiae]
MLSSDPVKKSDCPESQSSRPRGAAYRGWRAIIAAKNHYLLPETNILLFRHVTRLQVMILAVGLLYLIIFSLIGIVYKTWVTPVEHHSNLHNTRTGLGGWSDRIGVLAYALTPLSIGLATRESIPSLLTGIPYQNFMFLHRWTGRVIFAQSFLHTLGWTVIEGRLYQPQPSYFTSAIAQKYMIFGIVAMTFLTFLYVFSTGWAICLTGYEFFVKSHYVVAWLFVGCCWGHWTLLKCWMIPSLILLALDLVCQYIRVLLIHLKFKRDPFSGSGKGVGFQCARAAIQSFVDSDGVTVVTLKFKHHHGGWKLGQHFYLCFPELSIWQSHPFTPSLPPIPGSAEQEHLFIVRCLGGESARLGKLATSQSSSPASSGIEICFENNINKEAKELSTSETLPSPITTIKTTPVILIGPYGISSLPPPSLLSPNLLTIAGGTGISFTLPFILSTLQIQAQTPQPPLGLIWIIRRLSNISWITPSLISILPHLASTQTCPLYFRIIVTRDLPSSPSLSYIPEPLTQYITYTHNQHPSILFLLDEFSALITSNSISTQVLGSGPVGMASDVRDAVARRNNARKGDCWGCYWDGREF